jgi:hypothetical protein
MAQLPLDQAFFWKYVTNQEKLLSWSAYDNAAR